MGIRQIPCCYIVTRLPWNHSHTLITLSYICCRTSWASKLLWLLRLPWGPSYHSNKICGTCLLFQETLVPNISLMWLKTNKLLFQSGCHGNWVTIAMRYAADAFISKNLHSKYKLNTTEKGIIEISLWLLWQQVTIAMRYVADAYYLKESPYQIWTQ